jgi:hypothetical protein
VADFVKMRFGSTSRRQRGRPHFLARVAVTDASKVVAAGRSIEILKLSGAADAAPENVSRGGARGRNGRDGHLVDFGELRNPFRSPGLTTSAPGAGSCRFRPSRREEAAAAHRVAALLRSAHGRPGV